MSALASVLFFAGGVVAVWNMGLWLVPRGFGWLWPYRSEPLPYAGGTVRHHYRWANGVPILASVLVLLALAVDGFSRYLVVRAMIILLLDPRGLVWEVVRDVRSGRRGA